MRHLTGCGDLRRLHRSLVADRSPTLVITRGARGRGRGRATASGSRCRPRRSSRSSTPPAPATCSPPVSSPRAAAGRPLRACLEAGRDRRGRGHLAFRRTARSRPARSWSACEQRAAPRGLLRLGARAASRCSPMRRARPPQAMVERGVDLVYGGGRLGPDGPDRRQRARAGGGRSTASSRRRWSTSRSRTLG